MAKIKNPLAGLGARGSLGGIISFVRRRGVNIAEKMPIPEDAKSLAQLSWRHMYQKAVALWHALSAGEKQEWESLARAKHMTGFAWFISQALKPNPGLYLPLQGGTMAGNIDMAGHSILNLPGVTKELFIPAGACYSNGTLEEAGFWAVWCLDDPLNRIAVMTMKAPDDFVSFTSLKALWSSPAVAGNMWWSLRASYAAEGEHYATHNDLPAYGVTATSGEDILNLQEPANPLTLADLQKDDALGVEFHRVASNEADTLEDYVNFFGFLFTYVAEA